MIAAGSNACVRRAAPRCSRAGSSAGLGRGKHIGAAEHIGRLRERGADEPGVRSSRSWITVEPFWESRVAGQCETAASIQGSRYRRTIKQTANHGRVTLDVSPGIALAMFLVRDARCPALTQERAMPAEIDSPSSSRALVTARAASPRRASAPPGPARRAVPHPIDRDRRAASRRRASAAAPKPTEVIAAYRATVERLQRLNEKSD